MPKPAEIAYQCAPVICQKVNNDNPRGDFITRVDFTDPGNMKSMTGNWPAVNAPVTTEKEWKKITKSPSPKFTHRLLPYVYYSVAETHTHYFVLYAIYHPQDWERAQTPWTPKGPRWRSGTEHEHDMEGALVVVGKRDRLEDLRADAMITISHWWFYSYANWHLKDLKGKEVPVFSKPTENRYRGSRVNRENLDGKLWAIWHIDENAKETMRPKLFVQAKGHGVRGDKDHWSGGSRIVRYCPSPNPGAAEEPTFSENNKKPSVRLFHRDSLRGPGQDVKSDVCRYGLIDIFAPKDAGGLWKNRDNRRVFLVDDRGQDCFVAHKSKGKGFEAGSAKPPWSWDDCDDRHTSGELALQPAHITYDYLSGLREFSREYVRNPYLGI